MDSRRVFVIHGRDLLARDAVGHVLERLGVEPVFLGEIVTAGQTWIEGLDLVGNTVGAAVVIFKGDDLGSLRWEPHRQTVRARQNVLFELGFMIGKLGRGRVIVLYEDGVEIPSDYGGASFVRLAGESDWKVDLAVKLQSAGLDVKRTQVLLDKKDGVPGDQEFIYDSTERTRKIVADLSTLLNAPPDFNKEVRFAGFLSPFAIGAANEMARRRDGSLLLDERNGLLELARGGAQVRCIVTPPSLASQDLERIEIARGRVVTLLDFLQSGDPGLDSIHWATAPLIENYVYVVGGLSFFQGFKGGDDALSGFAVTERRTLGEELNRQARVFDMRFNLHSTRTLEKYGTTKGKNRVEDLRLALINALDEAVKLPSKQNACWAEESRRPPSDQCENDVRRRAETAVASCSPEFAAMLN